MRQVITIVLVLMLSVCTVIAADFDNNDVEPVHPEYAGIAQNLVNITLTSGSVKCSGMTIVKQNYYVSIVWKLQMTSSLNSNDFSTIETWTDNGFGFHTFLALRNIGRQPMGMHTGY